MRQVLVTILLTTLTVVSGNTQAKGTGNSLYKTCKALEIAQNPSTPDESFGEASVNAGYCLGFVDGVYASMGVVRYSLTNGASDHCVPNSVTSGQMVKVVMNYLDDNPNELHLPAYALTMKALLKAFPCENIDD